MEFALETIPAEIIPIQKQHLCTQLNVQKATYTVIHRCQADIQEKLE